MNVIDQYGRAPLLCAVENGDEEMVKLLLDHGATVDTRDRRGRTVLESVENYGNRKIATLLRGMR